MTGAEIISQGSLAVALSCFGLMADLYDFHIVNLIRPSLEEEFGAMTANQDAMLTGAALLGAFVGMLVFGFIADYVGRRTLFITTSMLIGVASLGSAMAGPVDAFGLTIFHMLTGWRFLMGLGIGGEYPLAAAFTTESTSSAASGRALSLVYFGMFLGTMLAPAVVMCLSGPLDVPGPRLWRCSFGFGAILALLVAALRWASLEETRDWQAAASSDRSMAMASVAMGRDREEVSSEEKGCERWKVLWAMRRTVCGTVGVWLIYDVVTYGTGLYTTTLFPAAAGFESAKVVLAINLMSVPGYFGALILAERAYQKHLQLVGLFAMTMCFALMTVLFGKQQVSQAGALYVSLFGIQKAFDNLGPGFTTFTVPGQVYPTRIRTTAHGISAASGKLGAVVGTVLFPYLNQTAGMKAVFGCMSVTSAAAALWVQLYTPLYDMRTLEEIARLDTGTDLLKQAMVAESLLWPTSSGKAEYQFITNGADKINYGIAHGEAEM
jgi:PHS family inorganic phosphate transporter-like MFS transporter